jgi:type IV pilus assembly protein PilB
MNLFKDEWLVKPLIDAGILSAEALEELRLNLNESANVYLYDKIISNSYLTEDQLCNILSQKYHIPVVNLESVKIDKKATEIIPEQTCRKHKIFPYSLDEDSITIAVFDPVNLDAENEISFLASRLVNPVLSSKSRIEEKISEFYNPESYIDDLSERLSDSADSIEVNIEEKQEAKIETGNTAAPIVKLVNSILNDAIDKAASDIHIEPVEKKLLVRFRVDGILKKIMDIPKYAAPQLLARIKVISKLDVAETRKPQDGQAKVKRSGTVVDLRVSILPTSYGEKAVIRILDSNRSNIPFEDLGIIGDNLVKLDQVLRLKQGIILATGPTGSGKTTTLYAALNKIKSSKTNILTVEDPIEYTIEGINQVQVNEKAGITFATALRSFLRQDPDVILVGEIRDLETAEISIQAALTGHLVLSTVHTNNAIETITRLTDIGVDRYKVSSAISAIIAQRLVRRICPNCRQETDATISEKAIIPMIEQMGIPVKFYKGSGCPTCEFSGYKGRVGIYEILIIDSEIREMIDHGSSLNEIVNVAKKSGFKTFTQEALSRITSGDTDFAEISRVITLTPDSISVDKRTTEYTNHKSQVEQEGHRIIGDEILSPQPFTEHEKAKILVVEDDKIMRRLITTLLNKEEIYKVVEAINGQQALEMIAQDIPELILLDIMMPLMDGYEVCKRLRGDQKYAKIPIIMLSSLDDKEDLVKGFNLGVDDYISKPVDRQILMARINALLRRVELDHS